MLESHRSVAAGTIPDFQPVSLFPYMCVLAIGHQPALLPAVQNLDKNLPYFARTFCGESTWFRTIIWKYRRENERCAFLRRVIVSAAFYRRASLWYDV